MKVDQEATEERGGNHNHSSLWREPAKDQHRFSHWLRSSLPLATCREPSQNCEERQEAFQIKDGPRWGPKGAWAPPWVQIFNFLVIIYFIFVVGFPFQNLKPPLSLINLTSQTQIATIQPKNNKNIHNNHCILAKNYFTTKEPKKSCVIGEVS